VVVSIPPQKRLNIKLVEQPLALQADKFPSTRYMGSKAKLLRQIWGVASQFNFDTVVDLFAGSGAVSYMFKAQGKCVISNDYMHLSHVLGKALIENNVEKLSKQEAEALLSVNSKTDRFVEKTFDGLYYSKSENKLIDRLRTNIATIESPHQRAIGLAALIRACFKKRPRGIFTYVGHRYDDGRRDLQKSFAEQFLEAVDAINAAVFDNDKGNRAYIGDAMDFESRPRGLVYIDPPYYSPLSDNEYVRRYHFVEGLARNWQGVEIQEHTLTKKFKSYPTPFSSRKGATELRWPSAGTPRRALSSGTAEK
jgi:DNA adenine methylase